MDWKLYRDQQHSDARALVESLTREAGAYEGRQPEAVATDRGFDAPESREYLAETGIRDAVCPRSPATMRRRTRVAGRLIARIYEVAACAASAAA